MWLACYSGNRLFLFVPLPLPKKNSLDFKASSSFVKQTALELGFGHCGIVKATRLEKEASQLEEWLNRGYQGKMSYMESYFDLRVDPEKFLPGARSVIMMSLNYYTDLNVEEPKISRYAAGKDYHKVIRKKSKEFIRILKERYGELVIRAFVDSAPVLERAWAEKAGLGWNGRNTLTIHPREGSWFFLTGMMSDLEFDHYDQPIRDHCGTCRRCIDACPTDAIADQGYLLDASRCISYLTIELREAIPSEFENKMEGWAYGCDICQEVCPWNRFAKTSTETDFQPNPEIHDLSAREWLELSLETWNRISSDSPLKRAGLEKLKNNIRTLLNRENTDDIQ